MCAADSCGSSYDAQPGTCKNVNWALFYKRQILEEPSYYGGGEV